MWLLHSDDYLKETRNKTKRKAKQYEGFETSNIIDRQTVNNYRSFELIQCKTDIFKNYSHKTTTKNYYYSYKQKGICICIFTVQEPIAVINALEGERLD
jgi:hypothetical protein